MSDRNREYAEALYALAMETNQEKAYLEALRTVADAMGAQPEYIEVLSAPSIPLDERCALLAQAFEGAVPEQVLSFVQLLTAHGRIRSLPACVEEYRLLYQAAVAMSTAYVTSAVALTEAQQSALAEKLVNESCFSVVYVCNNGHVTYIFTFSFHNI